MSEVSFEEENTSAPTRISSDKTSAFAQLVIKTGVAKSQKEAEYLLLGIAIGAIVLAVAIPFIANRSTGQSQAAQEAAQDQLTHPSTK